MEDKDLIELEVRRLLAAEVESHRTYLQSQFKNLTWGVAILFTVAAAIVTFFFGKSFNESKEQLISTVDSKVIEYRLVESFKDKLDEYVLTSVENKLDEASTQQKIDGLVESATSSAVNSVQSELERTLIEAVTSKISQAQSLNSNELVKKIALPSGAVMSFNRQTCPPTWKEFAPAYGRFVRGIDKSGKSHDPDGQRKPGSLQDHMLESHSHQLTRYANHSPNRVGNGGSDRFNAPKIQERENTTTASSGGPETRPVNVALLFCVKE